MLPTRLLGRALPLMVLLTLPSAAAAHHDAGRAFAPSAHTRAVTSAASAVAWEGRPRRRDDRRNAVFASEPQVKVVYAFLKGKPDRFPAAASLLQADADAIDAAVSSATHGSRTVRFDRGTSGGPQFVDIQIVRLRHRARHYMVAGQPEVGQGSALQRELRAATHLRPGRDLLVYVDGIGGPAASGEADEVVEDNRPGSENRSNLGGRIAAVFGPARLPAASPAGLAPELALHELLHAFGAVQPDAPHATAGNHCYDGQDVMCYSDGSLRSGLYTAQACARLSGLVIDAPIDCGSDDYFSADPTAGSYLSMHWNTYDSVFLAPCSDPRMASACQAGAAHAAAAAPSPVAPAGDVRSSATALRSAGSGAALGTVGLSLSVGTSQAVASIEATPIDLPSGHYTVQTCLTLTSQGVAPWTQCWTRDTPGGPQRAPEEQLTLTRPPAGTAVVSGTVSITSGGAPVASTPLAPAIEIPGL